MMTLIEKLTVVLIIFFLAVIFITIISSKWIATFLAILIEILLLLFYFSSYIKVLIDEKRQYRSVEDYINYYAKIVNLPGQYSRSEVKLMNKFIKIIKKNGFVNTIKEMEKNSIPLNIINSFKKMVNDYEKDKNNHNNSDT